MQSPRRARLARWSAETSIRAVTATLKNQSQKGSHGATTSENQAKSIRLKSTSSRSGSLKHRATGHVSSLPERPKHQTKQTKNMKTYLAELNTGGKSKSFETMEKAFAYIAKNFQTEADEIGTWEDEDGRTLVWMTQDDADAAEDNSDVIATITESDA